MYALCVVDEACESPDDTSSRTRSDYYGNSEFDDYPVIYVNWNDATAYCEWAGARLPTEAEWEKAARGNDERTYPWGNSKPNSTLANYGLIVGDTQAVGLHPSGASPYGVLDMAGNAWEWVNDWFDSSYYNQSSDSNPLGPSTGDSRVLRGGAWSLGEANISSFYRSRFIPHLTNSVIGFRCVRSSR